MSSHLPALLKKFTDPRVLESFRHNHRRDSFKSRRKTRPFKIPVMNANNYRRLPTRSNPMQNFSILNRNVASEIFPRQSLRPKQITHRAGELTI